MPKSVGFYGGQRGPDPQNRRWEKARTSPFVHHRTPLFNRLNIKEAEPTMIQGLSSYYPQHFLAFITSMRGSVRITHHTLRGF